MTHILSTNYPIIFQEEAYQKLNGYIADTIPSTIFILVDENTHENCLSILLSELTTSIPFEIVEIESGEAIKNINTCVELWNVLTELGADRKSLLINLGGGVLTDMGGFVASTFKRGIPFINIPTTLLSMVDASVGGKTGVDLGVLKNQIGLFSNPAMVLIDTHYLETLSKRELMSGMAEIIKYGLSYDQKVWNEVKGIKDLNIEKLNSLIHRSVEIKNEIVLKDPTEKGLRKLLNFGHTIGHAVESYFLAAEDKESLTHGESIAIGMVSATYLSEKLLDFPSEKAHNIKETILGQYGLVPIQASDYDGIIEFLKHDKKNVGGQLNFVLLTDIEKFQIDCKVEFDLVKKALDFYGA